MSQDLMKHCKACGEHIRSCVEGRWIWEHHFAARAMIDEWREDGPYHIPCAEAAVEDDPDRYRLDEPADEPSDEDRDARLEDAEQAARKHYDSLRDAGRGHLVPPPFLR